MQIHVCINAINGSTCGLRISVFHPEVFARGAVQNCMGEHHVVWSCEAQIPRGAHRIQEGENAPPAPPK